MTNDRAESGPTGEAEPVTRLRIGDIVTLRTAPDERRLVSGGTTGDDGLFNATPLYDNDTRVGRFPGTVKISNVLAVVGHLDSSVAVELIVRAIVAPGEDPELEARLRSIMAKSLEQEETDQD